MKTKTDPQTGATQERTGDAASVIASVLWGLATGQPFSAVKTNSTFRSRGTEVIEDNRGWLTRSLPVSSSVFWAGRTRMTVRWTVFLVLVMWAIWPDWMRLPVSIIGGGILGLWVGAALRAIRTRHHRKHLIEPVSTVVAMLTGTRPEEVAIPPNIQKPGARAVIVMPAGWIRTESQVAQMRPAIAQRLGIPVGDLRLSWSLSDDACEVLMVTRRPEIPRKASPRDPQVQAAMTRCSSGSVVLGLARGDRPVIADLDSDAPHVMMCAGTGGGKSVLVSGVAAQLMRQGAAVEILDTKVSSHPWANDLPGLPYWVTTPDIHDALVRLGAEMQRRNDQLLGLGVSENAAMVAGYRRTLVVIEEINTLMPRLKTHWETTRERTDPKTSPAITALVEMANMGRSVKCHLLFCGQRMSVESLGGREAGAQVRQNAGVRIVSRFDDNMWRMLMDGSPRPASGIAGRAVTQISGRRRETQMLFWADDDAAVWATGGIPGGEAPDVLETWQPVDDDAQHLDPDETTGVDLTKRDDDDTVPIRTRADDTQPLQITSRRPAEPVTDPDAQKMVAEIEAFVQKSATAEPSHGEGTGDTDSPMPRDSAESEPGDTGDGDTASFVQMSMREWVTSRGFGTNTARGVDVLKSARKRDPKFPQPTGTDGATNASLFDPADLDAWAQARTAGVRLGEAS